MVPGHNTSTDTNVTQASVFFLLRLEAEVYEKV